MAISTQAKRSSKATVSIRGIVLLRIFLLVSLPIVLVLSTLYVLIHFSQLNVEIQTQKEAYQNELLELNVKLINLNESLEALAVEFDSINENEKF